MSTSENQNRAGLFFIALVDDKGDPYNAGYDGNKFASRADAEQAIPEVAKTFENQPEDWCVNQYPSKSKYTYTIFDACPNSSSGTEWPTHCDMEIEAESDAVAVEQVRELMSSEASGLNTSDGYQVGDEIEAIVWSEDGAIVGQPKYELTHEDLGVETDEERLARAAGRLDAVHLGDGKWAHYADETSRWYVVSADELAELCDYMDSDDRSVSSDAYSHWCAGTSSEEMPEGWEPGDDSEESDEDDLVTIEEMPDHLRGSHRAAGNWGSYPHNGATRRKVSQDEADAIIESDPEYAHVVGA